jgi:hypothetical protein
MASSKCVSDSVRVIGHQSPFPQAPEFNGVREPIFIIQQKSAKIPKSAEFQRALNSELREIPKGGTAEGGKGAASGPVHGQRLRAVPRSWSFRFPEFGAVRDFAPFGISRRSGFRAFLLAAV